MGVGGSTPLSRAGLSFLLPPPRGEDGGAGGRWSCKRCSTTEVEGVANEEEEEDDPPPKEEVVVVVVVVVVFVLVVLVSGGIEGNAGTRANGEVEVPVEDAVVLIQLDKISSRRSSPGPPPSGAPLPPPPPAATVRRGRAGGINGDRGGRRTGVLSRRPCK